MNTPLHTVRIGMVDRQVSLAQWALEVGGYEPGGVDGFAGDMFDAALRRFQEHQGLVVDGVAGAGTWPHLMRFVNVAVAAGVAIPDGVPVITELVESSIPTTQPVTSEGDRNPILWAMFAHEIEIPRSYLQQVADANNWFSDIAFGLDHRPFRAEVFDDIRDIDPDVYKFHYLADGAFGVEGVGGFHSQHIAAGDNDIDRYAVSDASLPRASFESVVCHEHCEGTENGPVNKMFMDPSNRGQSRLGETTDPVQGSTLLAPNGVTLEHYVTDEWLAFSLGENPARYDSAWRVGLPPIVTTPYEYGPRGGWSIWFVHATGQYEYRFGSADGRTFAAVERDRMSHMNRRLAVRS